MLNNLIGTVPWANDTRRKVFSNATFMNDLGVLLLLRLTIFKVDNLDFSRDHRPVEGI